MMSRGINIIAIIGLTAIGLLFSGCPQTTAPSVSHGDPSKEKPMRNLSATLEQSNDIPMMDKAAPLEFETATFGLG